MLAESLGHCGAVPPIHPLEGSVVHMGSYLNPKPMVCHACIHFLGCVACDLEKETDDLFFILIVYVRQISRWLCIEALGSLRPWSEDLVMVFDELHIVLYVHPPLECICPLPLGHFSCLTC
jgi:hypothetical protein